jgi:hypothetical protein
VKEEWAVTPSADIRIQVTETDPGTRAQAAIRAGHHRLLCALRPKVALLTELRLGSDAREAAWDGLVDFCTGTVRRHLSATDHALYTPAADAAATRLLVRALRAVSGDLDEKIDALSRAHDADAVATLAQHTEAVLAAHLAVEQTGLLPALAAVPGADLPALVSLWATLLDGDRLEPPAFDITEAA